MWTKSVGRRAVETIFPIEPATAPIAKAARVATAGSCFAQRIAANLARLGLLHLVTEGGPSFLAPAERQRLGYGTYSARYGNVYTAAQLAQLVERAYGIFTPREDVWQKGERVVDPFRPGIQSTGFLTAEECLDDRARHLAAVRAAIEGADVFVFTLGLTEAWRSREDGAVFPTCPGCGHGGRFDATRHEFVEFGIHDILGQLDRFLTIARAHNTNLRVVLTVSPVPLIATFREQHVLTATLGAKAALRTACDEIRRRHQNIDYFPSYEIAQIGGPQWAFAEDRRTVTPAAVNHIVDCFAMQFGLDVAATDRWTGHAVPIPRPSPCQAVQCDEDEILVAMAKERRSS